MNWILAIPLPFRALGLFVVGAVAGALVNLAVFRLACLPRAISPWSRPPKGVPPRRPDDRVPIFGWLGLSREAKVHGPGFWLRPMLVELLCALGLPLLYWWYVGQLGPVPMLPLGPWRIPPQAIGAMHVLFFAHAVLLALLLAASLIDADEKTIPDEITVPGTLFGLALATLSPRALLPADFNRLAGPVPFDFLRLTSPLPWPGWLGGYPAAGSLAIGLGCWWLWCVGLMPRTWYARHGWCRAIGLSLARLRGSRATGRLLLLGLAGSLGIAGVWRAGGTRWEALLTALAGMAAGGGLIWAVRTIGRVVLRREAMGFGDVTLMAMIGALAGWQACLMIFFLAPLAGLAIGLLNLLLHHDREIPYGPFLGLAAAVVLVDWAAFWERLSPLFQLGGFVPLAMVACLALMAALLALWRLLLAAILWAWGRR